MKVNIKNSDVLDKMLEIWEYNPKLGKIVNKRTKKPLKGFPDRYKYLRITLCINGRKRNVYYSRAVWALFYEQWPKDEIDHLNGDRRDNRIENLRECSHSENNLNKFLPWEPNEDTKIPSVYLGGTLNGHVIKPPFVICNSMVSHATIVSRFLYF